MTRPPALELIHGQLEALRSFAFPHLTLRQLAVLRTTSRCASRFVDRIYPQAESPEVLPGHDLPIAIAATNCTSRR